MPRKLKHYWFFPRTLNKNIAVLVALALLVIPFYQIYGNNDEKTIIGNHEDAEIMLRFDDSNVITNYSITRTDTGQDKEDRIESDEFEFRTSNKGFIVIDRENNVFVYGKLLSSDKYVVVSRVISDDGDDGDQEKKINRYLIDITSPQAEKKHFQRNLMQEMKDVNSNNNDKDKVSEIDKKIQEAEKRHQEKLERLEEENKKQSSVTNSNTGLSYEEYKKSVVSREDIRKSNQDKQDLNENTKEKDALTPMVISLSIPDRVYLEDDFRYEIAIRDDSKSKFDASSSQYIGNGIMGVAIDGKITDPLDQVIHEFKGVTDSDGLFERSFVVPHGSVTNGDYIIEFTSTQTVGKETEKKTTNKVFYALPEKDDGSIPPPPVAILEVSEQKITLKEGKNEELVTLNGSKSYSFGKSDKLSYSWNVTTDVENDDIKEVPKWTNSTNTIELVAGVFEFELIVSNQFWDSEPAYANVTVTNNATHNNM